jgi:hypothetical protein
MQAEITPLLQALNPENIGTYNRLLARAIGLSEAVAYASLVAKFIYYSNNDLLDDEGFFYSTVEDLEESTSLSKKQQIRVIKNLIEHGLIDCKRKGLPAKRYFKILYNEERLRELFKKNSGDGDNKKLPLGTTLGDKREQHSVTKGHNSKCQKGTENYINKTILKNHDIKNNINTSPNGDDGTTASNKTEASASLSEKQIEDQFNEVWKLYPAGRKQGKEPARKSFFKAIKDGVSFETIKAGLLAYKKQIEFRKTETKYIKQASTWFNQKCWEDEYETEVRHSEDDYQWERLGTWV